MVEDVHIFPQSIEIPHGPCQARCRAHQPHVEPHDVPYQIHVLTHQDRIGIPRQALILPGRHIVRRDGEFFRQIVNDVTGSTVSPNHSLQQRDTA